MVRDKLDFEVLQNKIETKQFENIGKNKNVSELSDEIKSVLKTFQSILTTTVTDLDYDDYQNLMEFVYSNSYELSDIYESLYFWVLFNSTLDNSSSKHDSLALPIVII